jgi:hypothetical protein
MIKVHLKMSIYFKSTLNHNHINRIVKCTDSFIKTGNVHNLYYYSIPCSLRKKIFKSYCIPFYTDNIPDKKVYPFTKFISKNIDVSIGERSFYIRLFHHEFERLSMIIYFLSEHSKEYTIYIDSEFTNNDLQFIQNVIDKFPDRNIKFKLSDIEFSYFQIKTILDNNIYIETKCLTERLEVDLPPYFEDNISFKNLKNNRLTSNIEIMRFFKIKDKNSGIVSEGALLPRNIEEGSLVILQ